MKRNGFTLTELLVVMAVIAVLAALLVPVAARALRRGHETKVKSYVTAVAQNLKTYRSEQKRWPPCLTDLPRDAHGDYRIVVAPGDDTAPAAWTKLIVTLLARENSAAETAVVERNNARRHRYLELVPDMTDRPDQPLQATTLLDHWGNQLCLVVDGNGDGVVHDLPDKKNRAATGFSTYADVAVWSWGHKPATHKHLITTW